jgi:hypothetical protein
MKEYGAPTRTFEQQGTANRDTNEDKLISSSRIRGKKADSSKLPNTGDNMDKTKVVLSALSKHENDTRYCINSKDFCVVWRVENPLRPLIKESLLI